MECFQNTSMPESTSRLLPAHHILSEESVLIHLISLVLLPSLSFNSLRSLILEGIRLPRYGFGCSFALKYVLRLAVLTCLNSLLIMHWNPHAIHVKTVQVCFHLFKPAINTTFSPTNIKQSLLLFNCSVDTLY